MKPGITLIASLLCLGLVACGPKSAEEQNKKAAGLVIDKLRVQHENTGSYPERLEDINFGSDQAAVNERRYNYFRKDDDTYSLQFFYSEEGKLTQSCTYESAGKAWTCGPG
jgi:5-deoxy-D-glucuronate isomerase